MEEGVAVVIWIFVIAAGFACAIGAAFIANAKNRNTIGYFCLGLFFPFIGIIIAAAVPRLDDADPHGRKMVRVGFLNMANPSAAFIEWGRVSIDAQAIAFRPKSGGPGWDIPLSQVSEITVLNRSTVPADLPLRDNMIVGGKLVLMVEVQQQGTQRPFYFCGPPVYLRSLVRRRLEPARTNAEVTKKCPYCAETIKPEAVKCRYCGSDLTAEGTGNLQPPAGAPAQPKGQDQFPPQPRPRQEPPPPRSWK